MQKIVKSPKNCLDSTRQPIKHAYNVLLLLLLVLQLQPTYIPTFQILLGNGSTLQSLNQIVLALLTDIRQVKKLIVLLIIFAES